MDLKIGLQELIRSTEVTRSTLNNRDVDDLVKINKSLIELYQAAHLIEVDDLVERNELLEKKLCEATAELHDLREELHDEKRRSRLRREDKNG